LRAMMETAIENLIAVLDEARPPDTDCEEDDPVEDDNPVDDDGADEPSPGSFDRM